MEPITKTRKYFHWLIALAVGLLGFGLTVRMASAQPLQQQPDPNTILSSQECKECHLDIANHWEVSAHANAFSDPYFQESWENLQKPTECLSCHTTAFDPVTGLYDAEGVDCAECHGPVQGDHPPQTVPIKADTEYCGHCHTTTIVEWRSTGHAAAGIGCVNCHDPHSQGALFEVADEMCINCHQDSMGAYLEDIHFAAGIGCVACHALVIPPDPIPETGIVPTGHGFDITPATCIACHTDSLHAGFSLPGWEGGPRIHGPGGPDPRLSEVIVKYLENGSNGGEVMTVQQQMQAIEAAQASRSVTLLFQGGLVGLMLGGSTAWFLAMNSRMASRREENNEDEERSTSVK